MYKNLREFVSQLEAEGELLRVKTPVSTSLEIAEITDRISKTKDGGKALLFENTGHNFPVLINMYGSEKRMALALKVGNLADLTTRIDFLLREATSAKDSIWDKLRALPMLAEMAKWLPKKSTSKGECQEVILKGDEAKLSMLPILKWWDFDGGKFVTLPMVNTIDPATGGRNVGMYRMQIFDDHTSGMHWHTHKTGARHYDGYKKQGERMPVSVALGGDPAYAYAATAPMPDNMDEYLLAGFLRQQSVKLVKCITNDIYVPADCDFVIEGYVDPNEEKVVEGPFGDHTGFYSLQDLYPRFHVTAITHRKDAIYPATIVGIPPQEDAYIAIATERIFLSPIRFAMQPEICDLFMPRAGTAHNIAIASMECRYLGQAHKLILSMWGAGQMMFNKYLIVTADNVDVRDKDQMVSILKNVDISKSVVRGQGVLDVLDHATATNGFGGKLAINATDVKVRKLSPAWSGVVEGVTISDKFLDSWGVLLLFADPNLEIDRTQLVANLNVADINYLVIFDSAAKDSMSGEDLIWIAAANTEPDRDISIIGSTMVVDARSKVPAKEGNPKRFPNIVTSQDATIELVDSRWKEYNIGEFIESPSRKYRALELSKREDW